MCRGDIPNSNLCEEISNNEEDWQKEFPEFKGAKFLVHYVAKKYCVVIDAHRDLDWKTTDEFDAKHQNWDTEISGEVARLEVLVGKNWPEMDQICAKRMLGECLVCALEGNGNASNKVLSESEYFISNKSAEISRYWIISTCGIILLVVVIIGIVVFLSHNFLLKFCGAYFFYSLLGACMGGMGTFVSIVLRIHKINIPSTSGMHIHVMESCAIMLVGSIAGFATVLLVKSGLAFPMFQESEHFSSILMILAMAAGLTTKWVHLVRNQLITGREKPNTFKNDSSVKQPTQEDN